MSRFVENAERILEVAESAGAAGYAVPEWTILFTPRGGIQMVADSDWPLESLQADRGARMAFRVSRQRGKVRVEGRAGARTCLFEAGKPNGAARLLPAAVAAYPLLTGESTPAMTARLRAETRLLLPAASD